VHLSQACALGTGKVPDAQVAIARTFAHTPEVAKQRDREAMAAVELCMQPVVAFGPMSAKIAMEAMRLPEGAPKLTAGCLSEIAGGTCVCVVHARRNRGMRWWRRRRWPCPAGIAGSGPGDAISTGSDTGTANPTTPWLSGAGDSEFSKGYKRSDGTKVPDWLVDTHKKQVGGRMECEE
jgi:hypothetical protein